MSESAAEHGPYAGRAGYAGSPADVTGGVPAQGAASVHAGRAVHQEPPADPPGAVPEQGAAADGRAGGVPEPRGGGDEADAWTGDAPARPEPLGVAVAATGNADVDAALARLADADALPTQSHIEVYEDVHHGLRDALAALDENRS
ncbi:hypothetical protein [Streptomyces sp. NPDC020983]|uniref:hypothetical protein n=1 Tax=Streptomyces sp. NPDC020983 TaxID=3365106 RepID=UPI0037A2839A